MEVDFKPELSLQRIALIRVVENLWEQPSMKIKILKFFTKHDTISITSREQDQKKEWIIDLVEQLNEINLPEAMKIELMYMIRPVGDRLLDWLKEISARLKRCSKTYPSLSDCLNNVCWTTFGTIDEIKIFESLYRGDPGNDAMDVFYMFEMACDYCLEPYIQKFWKQVSSQAKAAWSLQVRLSDISKIHLSIYWQWYLLGKPANVFVPSSSPNNYADLYGSNHSAINKAFQLSVLNGNDLATTFFFNQMTEVERNRILMDTVDKIVREKYTKNCRLHSLEDECLRCNRRYIDILVFLMQQMSREIMLALLLKYKTKLLIILFDDWPWRCLFLPMLQLSWDFFSKHDYYHLYESIVDSISDEYEYLEIKKCTSLRMLHDVWAMSPVHLKHSIVDVFWKLISLRVVSKLQDVSFISCVVNDEDMAPLRQDILNDFQECGLTLLVMEQYEVLDAFMNRILRNDEERMMIKEKLALKRACQYFIERSQYKELEDCLNWRFKTEDDKLNFKKEFKSDNICVLIISNLWRRYTFGTVETALGQFFQWLLFSPSEMMLLKQHLKSSSLFLYRLKWFMNNHPNAPFEQWLACCSFIPSEIVQLKHQAVHENVNNLAVDPIHHVN